MGFLLSPLTTLTFGITELGRAIYQYNALVKATRDAARYLSAQGPGTYQQEAKNLVVCGQTTACGDSALVPGLTTAMVQVCDSATAGCESTHKAQLTGTGVINLVTVTVTGYPFKSIVPFVVRSMSFNSISTTMRQM
jgi:Flp pilus assembly protein TadG